MIDVLKENWLFWAVVIFMGAMVLWSHSRGFFRTAFATFMVVLTIFFANISLPYIARLIKSESYISRIIIFLVLMIAVWIVLSVFVKATDIITKIPIIHGINQIAGALLGLALSLIIIWLVFIVFTAAFSVNAAASIKAQIESSKFLRFLYNFNLLKVYLR